MCACVKSIHARMAPKSFFFFFIFFSSVSVVCSLLAVVVLFVFLFLLGIFLSVILSALHFINYVIWRKKIPWTWSISVQSFRWICVVSKIVNDSDETMALLSQVSVFVYTYKYAANNTTINNMRSIRFWGRHVGCWVQPFRMMWCWGIVKMKCCFHIKC